jgi:hypothetical protein
VALRILRMGADEAPMTEIRGLIHKMGKWTTRVQANGRWGNGYTELGQGVVECLRGV